jgi:hypothetical protein
MHCSCNHIHLSCTAYSYYAHTVDVCSVPLRYGLVYSMYIVFSLQIQPLLRYQHAADAAAF